MKAKYSSHEDIMTAFVDSVHNVISDIENEMKFLDEVKNDDDLMRAHRTKKILLEWFRRTGNI